MTLLKLWAIAVAGLLAGVLSPSAPLLAQSSGISVYKPPPGGASKPPSGPGESRLPLVNPKVVKPGESTGGVPSGKPGVSPGSISGTKGAETSTGAAPGAAPGK